VGNLTDEDLMLLNSPDFVQVLDLNGDYQIQKVQKVTVESLPQDYRPSPKGHFNAPSCPDLAEVQTLLEAYSTQLPSDHSTIKIENVTPPNIRPWI
jgi:hypothetical protein